MSKDIGKYVKACDKCCRAKAFRRTHAGIPKRQLFMKRTDVQFWDLIGPFVEVDGMQYVAHGTNGCTCWNYGVNIANKETLTVAIAMHSVFIQSGWPDKVVTDQGGEFCSELQEILREQFGYKLVRCCPRSPTGNSFVEARHKQMNATFKIAVKQYGQSWNQGTPYLIWAANVRPYRATEVTPYLSEYGYEAPSMADVIYSDLERDDVQLPVQRLRLRRSPEDWIRTTRKNIEDAIAVLYQSKIRTMKENECRENERFYCRIMNEGDMCYVHRPITKKGGTSRLLYQNIGPFEVVGPGCPPNVDGSCNAYRLRCLATDKTKTYNVKDIHPYLSKAEKQEFESSDLCDAEEKEGEDERPPTIEFDPVKGDFLLITNFGDVEYHLIQVTDRPTSESIEFIWYGTTHKQRLTGFAKVWTHSSEPEIHSNASSVLAGYEIKRHTIPIEEVCQKTIVPVKDKTNKIKILYKLRRADVQDVLRYKS
jgi:hypothetical protein